MLQNNLRTIRKARKMTREEFANAMPMSGSALQRRETGEVALTEDEIRKAVDILKCSYEDILGERKYEKK